MSGTAAGFAGESGAFETDFLNGAECPGSRGSGVYAVQALAKNLSDNLGATTFMVTCQVVRSEKQSTNVVEE